uniref:branchpoint-bridging protein isoform X2 n=1 Tax=Erigeron canadensis TaxID=72917 RepID=UPI001CB8C11B|nr:branchpoint-bridging protein isoform X2 [Erigeron canadensis]
MTHCLCGGTLFEQTRLDQITQQLKSGVMEARDDHNSPASRESSDYQSVKKAELELERREVIGEILKLNSKYKAPADYKPLLKEEKVAIPIKEYPGRNFVGLIFGPAGDTQKRLEMETGAKIRVYFAKSDTKEESEITSSDCNEAHDDYDELYVIVTAETYEKVDAAVSLIELLVTPVLANTVAVSTNDPVSKDNVNADTSVIINYGVTQSTGSGSASPLARFQPYLNHWVPTGESSGFKAPPYSSLSTLTQASTPLKSAAMPSSFGPHDLMPGPHGSAPHNQMTMVRHPHMLQLPNMGYSGPPRNPSLPQLQVSSSQPNLSTPPFTPTGSNQNMRPLGPPIPRPSLPSTGWSQPPSGSPGTLGPNMPHIMQPTVRSQVPQFRPSSSVSPGAPPPPIGPQTVAPNPGPGSWFPSSTSTSILSPSIRASSLTALRPQQPISNDFTFQSHRAQNPTGHQFRPSQNPQGHAPQAPSFRPGINNQGTQSILQGFHRTQNSHQMGQHQGSSTMLPPIERQPVFHGHGPRPPPNHMGSRQFGPGPGSPAGTFPPRPGQAQQNHSSMGFRPQNLAPMNQHFRGNAPYSMGRLQGSNLSVRQQVYDPFSPTAVPSKPNLQSSRKQDSDPEYDDLMASVGVK